MLLYQLINSSTHQLINSSTHQLINSSTHQLINSSTHQLINSSTHQLINSSTHQLINSSTHQLINSSTHQLINSSTHQLINSSTHQLQDSGFSIKTFDTYFADGKTKLFATMYINNVTLDDDSLKGSLGSYECHAFAVGDPDDDPEKARARHGFSVSVITSKSYILVYCSFYIIFNVFLPVI